MTITVSYDNGVEVQVRSFPFPHKLTSAEFEALVSQVAELASKVFHMNALSIAKAEELEAKELEQSDAQHPVHSEHYAHVA